MYQQMTAVIRGPAQVNDIAERSVNDIHDYANATVDGDIRWQIVLVSGLHQIKLPQF